MLQTGSQGGVALEQPLGLLSVGWPCPWGTAPPQGAEDSGSVLISSVIISRVKENQLCLFMFLGDRAIWEAIPAIQTTEGVWHPHF